MDLDRLSRAQNIPVIGNRQPKMSKWDLLCKELSDSDEEATEQASRSTHTRAKAAIRDPSDDLLNSAEFHRLKAKCTVLLQTREPRELNLALAEIPKNYEILSTIQGFAFSKYVLLPLLILLREAHVGR